MRMWDLTAGAAKLELAFKALQEKSAQVSESWSDETYQHFVETYVTALEPRVKTMLDSVRRLAEVLSNAERATKDSEP